MCPAAFSCLMYLIQIYQLSLGLGALDSMVVSLIITFNNIELNKLLKY